MNTESTETAFEIRCPYCGGIHTATLGTYGDGAPIYGWDIFGVTCPETTPFGVTAKSSHRI